LPSIFSEISEACPEFSELFEIVWESLIKA
jgi:hypothetical protein